MLMLGERHGSIRPVLEAVTRFIESRAVRPAAEARLALRLYVQSLLEPLDAATKSAVLRDLIEDLWMSGSREQRRIAEENGVVVRSDENAAGGIMGAMRDVVIAYCQIAEEGNATLASELPLYTTQLVECLSRIVQTCPELLRESAQHTVTWPIMASKNYPKQSDFAKLADRIGLGAKCTVQPHKAQKWKPETPVNQFLLRFFDGMFMTKKECYFRTGADYPKLTTRTVRIWLDEIIMPALDHIRDHEGSWEGIKALDDMLKKVPYEAEHRKHVRDRIKAALEAMARNVED
jgi:hypothetical protein